MCKTPFTIILILAVLVAWVLGYINFPFIDQSQSFWIGLIGGLAIMLLVMVISKSRSKSNNYSQTMRRSSLLLPIVLGTLLVAILFLFVKNRSLETRVSTLNGETQNTNSISSSQEVKFLAIMNSLLDTVGNELKNSKNNSLSSATIGRIVAFSGTIEPYQFIITDTGVVVKLSPVKGHLLLGLLQMNMDSSSFNQIKRQVSFAGADLSNVNLSGYNLQGINLKDANFEGSSLKGTNLSNSNLHGANFYRTNMENVDLSYSKLEQANLSWSNMANSTILHANMERTNLSNSNLSGTNLTGTKINLSLLAHAIFNKANLTDCSIKRANLMSINLTEAKFVNVTITHSFFGDATWTNTQVDSAWLDKLAQEKVTGTEDLLESYKLRYDGLSSLWVLDAIN